MTWQEWVEQQAGSLGLKETSGYRDPQHNAAVGGAPNSYHTRGTPDAPGAIDIGGPAAQLTELFNQIKQMFQGRINELYLNLPAGGSQDVRNNQTIGTNPEAGNPQHLHVAISGTVAPAGAPAPASGIPAANRGDKALAAAPDASVCARSLTFPTAKGLIGKVNPLHQEGEGDTVTICWSDVWVYGFALAVIIGGSWMFFGRKE